MMKALRNTKEGLVIPSAWVKRWGEKVSVQRTGDLVILESSQREAARRRLARMVRKLRRASRGLGSLTPDDLAAEVEKVRRQRAGRR